MRNLLLLILLFIAGSWVSRKLRQAQEPMVRCAVCGVHTPKGDAIAAGGDYFCSREHAARHAAAARDAQ